EVVVGFRGQQDDRHSLAGGVLAIFPDELDAVEDWHVEIGQHGMDRAGGRLVITLGSVRGLDHFQARGGQGHRHHLPDGGGIGDGRDGLGHASDPAGWSGVADQNSASSWPGASKPAWRSTSCNGAPMGASMTSDPPRAWTRRRAASSVCTVVMSAAERARVSMPITECLPMASCKSAARLPADLTPTSPDNENMEWVPVMCRTARE